MSLCTWVISASVAVVVGSPELAAVGGVDKVGFDGDVVAMLQDAADENRADAERLADLAGIVFFPFELEDRAARHDFQLWQLRERADQAFGEAIAEIVVARVGGGIDEGQDGDGGDLRVRRRLPRRK